MSWNSGAGSPNGWAYDRQKRVYVSKWGVVWREKRLWTLKPIGATARRGYRTLRAAQQAAPIECALGAHRRPIVKNPNFAAPYGGHRYPLMGTDASSPSNALPEHALLPMNFAIEGPLADRIGKVLAGKQKVNKRPRGKRK